MRPQPVVKVVEVVTEMLVPWNHSAISALKNDSISDLSVHWPSTHAVVNAALTLKVAD